MIGKYYMYFKNYMQILKMLITHLLYRYGLKNYILVVFTLVFCLFVIFPLYLFTEISGYNIPIIETITYYLLVMDNVYDYINTSECIKKNRK